MWFARNLSLLFLCLFLTACGFRPLHVPCECTNQIAVPVKISTISNRDGQILRNYLVDMLTPEGAPQCPFYILDIKLSDTIVDIALNVDETSERKNVRVEAQIILKDARTNKVIYCHKTQAINSFAVISQNYFSDLIAEEYATKEALRILAEKITLLLTTYLDTCDEGCDEGCNEG